MEQPPGPSSVTSFDFENLCFICVQKLDKKNKKVSRVSNDGETRDRLLEFCTKLATPASHEIKRRIQSVSSLVTAQAQYHVKCYRTFDKVKYCKKYNDENLPYREALQQVFELILTSNKHEFTLKDFKDVMKDNFRHLDLLCHELQSYFGKDISIIRAMGKSPKFLYKKPSIEMICTDWHYDKDNVSIAAQQTILRTAASILSSDIKCGQYDLSSYPPADKFMDQATTDIPSMLNYFLDQLISDEKGDYNETNEIKKNSIAHCIVCILRPKSFISTFQLSVGTYIHRKTGSKVIIDLLSKLGVSSTYQAIQLYEASTIMDPPTFNSEDAFVQFVFDNTDHNVSTLDGKETFHCLGGIAVYTPIGNVGYTGGTKKLKKIPKASTLAMQKQIRTIPFKKTNEASLSKINYKSVESMDLLSPPLLPLHYSAYLWGKYRQLLELPSWGGFMEVITSHMDYSVSKIVCLPFINEPPSNLTTLNTSLLHALEESTKQKQKTCFVTYDQPLYLKARTIVLESSNQSKYENIVVRLGGFHLLMSYLGAIGYIMAGSGLEDLWSLIYAAQSTKKMISGHAYSRAIRAHILTFTALGSIICEAITSEKEEAKDKNNEGKAKYNDYVELLNKVDSIFSNWNDEPPLLEELQAEKNIIILTEEFNSYLARTSNNNPTAKLWSQYFESVSVALQFIEAERLGDWQLHLQCVKKMLPLFHASGHFAYAKSAQIYLQDMIDLELKMDPTEYDQFTLEGYFTIKRSYKAWCGVWSDMTIEQTLNRFFGTDLKHGRGVTPSVVARYLLGMPAAFSIMENLEEHFNLKSENSEQHKDLSSNRMKKDMEHLAMLVQWLRGHNPFTPCPTLISISTGIIGSSQINCHKAYEYGNEGMATMVNKNAEFSLTKLYKVRNLLQGKSFDINNDISISIDPLMLFQRISLVIHGDEKKMLEAFQYELSPYPLSLYDENGLMRKTAKSQLYTLFVPEIGDEMIPINSHIIIDGGWLLHQIVWPHGRTFGEIFELYYNFIVNNYGINVTVVFDGYYHDVIGVKSYERYRRKEKTSAADICIVEDNVASLTSAKFFSNVGNKVKFVEKLSTYFQQKGISTQIAREDADCLIVYNAVKKSETINNPITIIGNDIDLLILLVALAPEEKKYYFHKSSGGKSPHVLYCTKEQNEIKPIILFAHAFAGCDSTSAFYRKGKKSIIKILQKIPELANKIKFFYMPNQDLKDLYPIAETIVRYMYNNNKKKLVSMENLRYQCFKTAVASSKKDISLASLPPTKEALIEHVKRVYYQVQLWLGNSLEPTEWGWTKTPRMLIPTLNTKEPAPENLLSLIHCGCNGDCSTKQCSCQKMGLRCNQMCRQCNGESCMNRQVVVTNQDDEISEDEDDPECDRREENEDDNENDEEDEDENEDVDGDDEEIEVDVDKDEDDIDEENQMSVDNSSSSS